MARRRVVVTGLGIVSPIGNTVPEAWERALAGTPGIGRITRFDASRLSSQIAGEVKGFDVTPYMSTKEARRMDLFIHYALQATADNAERIGINFGSGIGGLPMIEAMHDELSANGPRRISPFFIPGTIINMIAGLLSIEIGAKGPNLAMVTACTTSTHCIGEAAKSIRYGEADVMVAGGSEAVVTELAVGGFAVPVLGHETGDGLPIDIAWPDYKVALDIELNDTAREELAGLGWTVVAPEIPAIRDALARAGDQ